MREHSRAPSPRLSQDSPIRFTPSSCLNVLSPLEPAGVCYRESHDFRRYRKPGSSVEEEAPLLPLVLTVLIETIYVTVHRTSQILISHRQHGKLWPTPLIAELLAVHPRRDAFGVAAP